RAETACAAARRGAVRSSRLLADEPVQRLVVLRARALDDDGGQARPRSRLVPVEGLEIVAHVLLVEALRGRAAFVARGRPKARRIGRQHLVHDAQLAVLVEPELELRVGDDDAALARVLDGARVERERRVLYLARELGADQALGLGHRDVL